MLLLIQTVRGSLCVCAWGERENVHVYVLVCLCNLEKQAIRHETGVVLGNYSGSSQSRYEDIQCDYIDYDPCDQIYVDI